MIKNKTLAPNIYTYTLRYMTFSRTLTSVGYDFYPILFRSREEFAEHVNNILKSEPALHPQDVSLVFCEAIPLNVFLKDVVEVGGVLKDPKNEIMKLIIDTKDAELLKLHETMFSISEVRYLKQQIKNK